MLRCGNCCYVVVVAPAAPVLTWLCLLVIVGHDWADPPSFPLAGDMTRFVWITVSDDEIDSPQARRAAAETATRQRSLPTLTYATHQCAFEARKV